MNGVFNTGLHFWQIIVGILTVVFGFVAVRISLSFDLNKYLESRRGSYTQKLRNACTHVRLEPVNDGQIQARSLFISPPGTMQWQCQRCGTLRYQQDGEFEKEVQYYLDNIDDYHKKNKKFAKLLKKSGQV
jgi:hypothetical protein